MREAGGSGNDEGTRSRSLVGPCAILFLGFGLYIFAPWSLYESWRTSKTWKEMPAVVAAIEDVQGTADFLGARELRVYYEYGFEGKRHKDFMRGRTFKHLRVGDAISVYVNPDKPKESVFKRSEFQWSALLGVVCIAAGLWLGWSWAATPRPSRL